MHGFKPQHNGRAHYAGGGVIDGFIKGFRPKKPAPAPAPSPDAQQGQQQPAQSAKPASSGNFFTDVADQRLKKAEEGMKDGGTVKRKQDDTGNLVDPVVPGTVDVIQGPGTGTSDDVPAEMERGTHILPADTTEEVMLSNGEAAVSPDVVNAVGQAALDALRSATHSDGGKPGAVLPGDTNVEPIDAAPRGFRPQDEVEPPRFATGGTIGEDEDEDPNARQTRMYVAGAQAANPPPPTAPAAPPAQQAAAAAPAVAATSPAAPPVDPQARVAQIPTATGAQNEVTGGVRVDSSEAGRNLNNAVMGFAPAVGAMARGVLGAGNVVGSVLPGAQAAGLAAGAAGVGAIAGDTNAMKPPGGAAAPVTPFTPSTAGAGRGVVNPALATPSAPTAAVLPSTNAAGAPVPAIGAPLPAVVAPPSAPGNNVVREGNSYSGANITSDGMTINGKAPGGGFAVVQATPAATAGAAAPAAEPRGFAPQGPALRDTWQFQNQLRNASFGMSGSKEQVQSLLNQAEQDERNRGAVDTANVTGATQRDVAQTNIRPGMANATANAREGADRNAIARDRLSNDVEVSRGRLQNETAESGRRNQATDLSTSQIKQITSLQQAVLQAKTPEERAKAESDLRVIQGKAETDKLVVVPGAKNADGSQDAATLWNSRTGQQVQGGGQQAATPRVADKAGFEKLKSGDTYIGADGKTYRKP